MFKKLSKVKKHHQFIYALIIGISVISIWRGIWMLLDIYLLPNNPATSATIPLVLGIIILLVTHQKLS